MTQLSNVNKVDPHTGFWWTLLKAQVSLHLGPVADVWLRVQSSHLARFWCWPRAFLVVCKTSSATSPRHVIITHAALNWSRELLLHTALYPWRTRTCVEADWWTGSLTRHLTSSRPQSSNRHVKSWLFNQAALKWLTFDVLNYLPSLLWEYLEQVCGRNPVL